MKKKISLITGVAGTIGSNLAKLLINKNHFIYGIDNLSLGNKKNIKDLINNKNFEFIKCDVANEKELSKKISLKLKIDFFWLLAANSDIKNGSKSNKIDLRNTLFTTIKSLNYFSKNMKKNSKICFSSSSAIYGNYHSKFRETDLNLNPISNYGQCKLLSERYLINFCEKKKIKYLILRFPNVVGKPFTHGVIFDLTRKLIFDKKLKVLGNGSQKKPYVHVSELVQCMHYLMNKELKFNIYLLSPKDNGISVKEIANCLKKIFKINKKIIYENKIFGWPGDVPIYSYEIQRLKKTGYKFNLSSKDAIIKAIMERNIDWFKK